MDGPGEQSGIQEFEERRRQSSFAGDFFRLFGGTLLVQVILFFTSPIITRIYGPQAYGLSSLFLSIVGILGVVICLRYESSIMLPEKQDDAASLFLLSVVIAVVISLASIPILFLVEPYALQLLNAPEMGPYFPLISLSLLLYGLFISFTYWNSRSREFSRLSMARVGGSTTTTALQLSAGYTGFNTGGNLILSGISGSAMSSAILGAHIWKRDRGFLKKCFRWSKLKAGLRRYKNFSIYDTWSGLLNMTSWQLPPFLLAIFFTSAEVGYYALGIMTLQLPVNLIGASVSQVFFQRSAEHKMKKRDLSRVVIPVEARLFSIGLFPFLMLVFIGPYLYSSFFGGEWAQAGLYAGVLAPWMFLVFATSPISTLFAVLEKQKVSLALNGILFPLRFGALVVGGLMGSPLMALILFSLVNIFAYGTSLALLLLWSKVSARDLFRELKAPIAIASSFLLIVGISSLAFDPFYVMVIGAVLLLCYFFLIFRNDDLLKGQARQLFHSVSRR